MEHRKSEAVCAFPSNSIGQGLCVSFIHPQHFIWAHSIRSCPNCSSKSPDVYYVHTWFHDKVRITHFNNGYVPSRLLEDFPQTSGQLLKRGMINNWTTVLSCKVIQTKSILIESQQYSFWLYCTAATSYKVS